MKQKPVFFLKLPEKCLIRLVLLSLFLEIQVLIPAFGQNSPLNLNQDKLFPLAPNAAEFGRLSAVKVGLFTGSAQYSIPIYEFKTPNLSLPITLDYSSNGLLVDKIGSWVGFDWILSVGGVINRYRKGKVDKPGTRPAYPYNWNSMTATQKKSYLDNDLSYGDNDLEPDEFTYIFPNNTGKFVFDELGKPILIPYSNLKIETNTSGGAYTFFKITTTDGVIYKFENTGSTLPVNEPSYISSWYLTQIIHPSGDVISFNYTTCNMNQFFGVVQSATAVIEKEGVDTGQAILEMTEKVNTVNVSTLFLDSIIIQGHGSIVFERKNREDSYQDYRLRKITVKDNLNNSIKQFVFYHQFTLRSQYYQSKSILDISESNGQHNKRMFLDSLQIQSPDSSRLCSYEFYYNNLTELPAKFSYAQDHWGYFNGKYNTDFAIRSEAGGFQTVFNNLIPTDADRSPDYTYSRKGMLQKIVFPTSGYTTIEYEANSNSAGNTFGGCRVLMTKTYESASATPEIKKYIYSGVQSSIYYKYFNDYWIHYADSYCVWIYSYRYGVLSSNSYLSQSINGLYHVLYGCVEILSGENAENGKEVHLFNTSFDEVQYPLNGNQIYPLVLSNTGWKAGLLSSNYMANTTLSEVWRRNLSYNFNETRNGKTINCLAVEHFYNPQCFWADDAFLLSSYNVVPYTINSVWYYINQEVVTQYAPNGNVVSTKNYSYNDYGLLDSESLTTSDGTDVETKTKYPSDINTGVFSSMKTLNMLNYPIEVVSLKNSNVIGSALTTYKSNGTGYVPDKVYKLEFTTPFSGSGFTYFNGSTKDIHYSSTAELSYDVYNSTNGNIRQTTGRDGIVTSYLWDITGNFPMAQVKGATYSQISPQNGQAANYSSLTLRNNLNSLVPSAYIQTFSYKPLVGMTSQTNPNGKTTYYEYDSFGRLQFIKDDQSKILKKFDYHYKN